MSHPAAICADYEPDSDFEDLEGAEGAEVAVAPPLSAGVSAADVAAAASPQLPPATLEEAAVREAALQQQLVDLQASFAAYRKAAEPEMLGGMLAEDLRCVHGCLCACLCLCLCLCL